MLDLLPADSGGTAKILGQQLPVTCQAVAKHRAVLDRVDLVNATAAGCEKRYHVDAAQLASVGSAWDARMQRMKQLAESMHRAQKK